MSEFYSWIDNHRPLPIARFSRLWVPKYSNKDWVQFYEKWNSSAVVWKAPWLKATKFIVYGGDFKSVPLIGFRGYVTYSPLMVMRQYGYKQIIPALEVIKGEEIENCGQTSYQQTLSTFLAAWKDVKILDEWNTRMEGEKAVDGYAQWFKTRKGLVVTEKAEAGPSHRAPQIRNYEYELTAKDVRITELERDLILTRQTKDTELEACKHQMAEMTSMKDARIESLMRQLADMGVERDAERAQMTSMTDTYEELRRLDARKRRQLEGQWEHERDILNDRLLQIRNSLRTTREELKTIKGEHENDMKIEKEQYRVLETSMQEVVAESTTRYNGMVATYTDRIRELEGEVWQLTNRVLRQERCEDLVKTALKPGAFILDDIQDHMETVRAFSGSSLSPGVKTLMKECRGLVKYIDDVVKKTLRK